jgi:hypothetical protein
MNQLPAVLRISYRTTRADYVALCMAMMRDPWRRIVIEIAIYLALVAITLFAASNFDTATFMRVLGDIASFAAPWWLYVLLVAGPLLALAHPQWVALIAAFTYNRNAIADKDVALSFDGNGIVTTAPNLVSHLAWDAIIRVIETPTHAFLAISRREALILPRRAFADEHDWKMLLGFIRARLAANVAA